MVKLEDINSRMKDFYDIWILIQEYDLNKDELAESIRETFQNRKTVIPKIITALTKEFSDNKQVQWKAFKNKQQLSEIPDNFSVVTSNIRESLNPILIAIKDTDSTS